MEESQLLPEWNGQRLLRTCRGLVIKWPRAKGGKWSGAYGKTHKARGMTYKDIRQYQIGDEVRRIDWNTTARLMEPYVKEFEEEKELEVIVVLDVSGSMRIDSDPVGKLLYGAELTATIGQELVKRGQKFGLLVVSDQIEMYQAAKGGYANLIESLSRMCHTKARSWCGDLRKASNFLDKTLKRPSLIIYISDWLSEGYEKSLSVLAVKHSLMAIRLTDTEDKLLEAGIGMVPFVDGESGELRWVDTNHKNTRRAYQDWKAERLQYFERALATCGGPQCTFDPGEDYVAKLGSLMAIHV